MKGLTFVALVAVIGLMVGGAVFVHGRTRAAAGARPPSGARAPDGQRVQVEVLNATKVRGLARRATEVLRDRGFDVVAVGTSGESRASTLVLDLSGHPDWANRVARALAPARVVARRDSSRYLDVAVVLGTSWRPPAKPFYP